MLENLEGEGELVLGVGLVMLGPHFLPALANGGEFHVAHDLGMHAGEVDAVDELLLKTIDAPTKKVKRRNHDEAR